MMQKVVLWPNPLRDTDFQHSLAVAALCAAAGTAVAMPDGLAVGLVPSPHIQVCPQEEALDGADCLVALGGDGTMLHLASVAADHDIPMLGINLGRVGFLSELEPSELSLLTQVLAGKYTREARMLLALDVYREDTIVFSDIALNDVVLSGGAYGRFVSVKVMTDEMEIMTCNGDGVIVATPTGSTAYSMAAGGPVVEPDAENLVVTSICAQAFFTKSVVLSPQRVVTLKPLPPKPVVLFVDGQESAPLELHDVIKVRKSQRQITLLRAKENSFFKKLGSKFHPT